MKTRNALCAMTILLMVLVGLPTAIYAIPVQVAKLVASDGAPNSGLGNYVSISGDTALIGAPYVDMGGNTDQGAAYIFYRDQGGPDAWGQVARLTEPDGGWRDFFGSVALDGDTAVVGAPFFGGDYHGRAYVFYRNQGGPDAWGLVTTLIAADGAGGDFYGSAVAVDGDTILIGANQWWSQPGAVYIYYRNQGGPDAWGQVAKLTASDGAGNEYFGGAVALQGDTAVIAAPYAPAAGPTPRQGKVYIFYRDKVDPKAWHEVAKLTAPDAGTHDLFGTQVRLSGDTVIIGAPVADVNGNIDQGAAYIFYRNQGGPDAWGQVAKLTAANGGAYQCFGSVSINGDTAIVGRSFGEWECYGAQGAVYIYQRNQGGPDAWGQTDMLTSDEPGDGFGVGVSLSGNTAVVGAWGADVGDNTDQGAAYVYDLVQPPTVQAGGPYVVAEGGTVGLTATGVDPQNSALTYVWDLDGDGTFETPGQSVTFSAAALDGPSTRSVAVQVTDSGGLTGSAATTVEVQNVAPNVGVIKAPLKPVAVNTAMDTNVSFSDPSVLDTHTAVWDWGDGVTSAGTVNETNGSGSVSGNRLYATAGTYTVKVTVTDDDGGVGEALFSYVVVYDPSAGFVTGGGWIDSPTGAYIANATLTGRANFGFEAKYQKGATIPTGQTEFQFQRAGLNFHSTSYDWLVVSGAKATYKGTGTINGSGRYGFLLSVIDGQVSGGQGSDKFRLKIWNKDQGDALVYDNQMACGDNTETADPCTVNGGGSIVIHAGGKGKSANDASRQQRRKT